MRRGSVSSRRTVRRLAFTGSFPGGGGLQRVGDAGTAHPAGGLGRVRVRDFHGPDCRGGGVEGVGRGEVVVVDGAEVTVRAVGEHGGHDRAGVNEGGPGGDAGGGARAPAAADEAAAGQPTAAVHGLGRADPVDLVEGVVGDVARVDAAAQAAHQPRPGGLAEDGGAGRVDADQPQRGPTAPQWTDDARAVAAGAHAAHQHVQVVEPVDEFGGQRGVTGAVVRVVVLVRPVRVGQHGEQFPQPAQPRRLPAAPGRRAVHDLQPHSVGAQQLPHGRLQFTVADQYDGMAEGLAREGEPDAEGAGGGLHHRRAGPQFAALTGAKEHRHRGPCLHAARRESLQLGPETGLWAGQVGSDTDQGRATEQGEQLRAGDSVYDRRGHRPSSGRGPP